MGTEPDLVLGRGAPRGALEPCGDERTPPSARRSGPVEAEGSLIRGTPGRAASSPDKAGTCENRQMVRVRQARRDGVTTVNQRMNASQEHSTSSNLTDLGWVAVRTSMLGEGTLGPVSVAGREATPNVCGVGVARPQGHSWAPRPSSGSRVNVGTTPMVPPCRPARAVDGKARRRLMLSGWGGGPVVVRARESRAHGEGVQRDRGIQAERGGRR